MFLNNKITAATGMGCSGDCYVRKSTVEELTAYGTIGSLGVALSLLESVLGILLTVVG